MSVDSYPIVVDDLGDNSELAGGGTFVDKDNPADLNEALECGRLWRLERRISFVLPFRFPILRLRSRVVPPPALQVSRPTFWKTSSPA